MNVTEKEIVVTNKEVTRIKKRIFQLKKLADDLQLQIAFINEKAFNVAYLNQTVINFIKISSVLHTILKGLIQKEEK